MSYDSSSITVIGDDIGGNLAILNKIGAFRTTYESG